MIHERRSSDHLHHRGQRPKQEILDGSTCCSSVDEEQKDECIGSHSPSVQQGPPADGNTATQQEGCRFDSRPRIRFDRLDETLLTPNLEINSVVAGEAPEVGKGASCSSVSVGLSGWMKRWNHRFNG